MNPGKDNVSLKKPKSFKTNCNFFSDKREFIKVLENTKTADKFKLWQNIWNQALENRQTKTDTVIIQIPDPKDLLRQKMIHLEYTIGELEELLLKDQNYRNSWNFVLSEMYFVLNLWCTLFWIKFYKEKMKET